MNIKNPSILLALTIPVMAMNYSEQENLQTKPSQYSIKQNEEKILNELKSKNLSKQDVWDELRYASAHGHQTTVEWLSNTPDGKKPDIFTIYHMLYSAIEYGQQNIIEWLLNWREIEILDEDFMDNILFAAAKHDNQDLVKRLLNQPKGKRPTQEGIDNALPCAVENDNQTLVECLLNQPQDKRPTEKAIDNVLKYTLKYGQQNIALCLLNQPEDRKPLQNKLTYVLNFAVRHNYQIIIRWLLNQPENRRPNQTSIIDIYRNVVAEGRNAIAALLAPHVPLGERVNLNTAVLLRGSIAFEIHNYAEAPVKNSANQTVALIDAVFANMQQRIDGKVKPYNQAQAIINKAIAEYIPEEEREKARTAAFFKLASDSDYKEKISLAVSFMQKFYPGKTQQWIEGFVQESIEAYKGRDNSTSCSKGIKERIATGMRGIDPELDTLFAQAENPALINAFYKNWNPSKNAKWIAKQLISEGVASDAQPGEIGNIIRKIMNDKLNEYGLAETADSAANIDAAVDAIVDSDTNLINPDVIKALKMNK